MHDAERCIQSSCGTNNIWVCRFVRLESLEEAYATNKKRRRLAYALRRKQTGSGYKGLWDRIGNDLFIIGEVAFDRCTPRKLHGHAPWWTLVVIAVSRHLPENTQRSKSSEVNSNVLADLSSLTAEVAHHVVYQVVRTTSFSIHDLKFTCRQAVMLCTHCIQPGPSLVPKSAIVQPICVVSKQGASVHRCDTKVTKARF